MKAYSIDIAGLSNKIHYFDFEIADKFFNHYGTDLLSGGSFQASIELNKHETFMEVGFNIKGEAKLICDRSLEPFDYPVDVAHKIIFKFGDEDKEITDEIVMINREAVTLALGQFIYEFIGLAVPMRKLHPKFQHEEDDEEAEGKIIYSSDDQNEEEHIDPRWEQLKKLK